MQLYAACKCFPAHWAVSAVKGSARWSLLLKKTLRTMRGSDFEQTNVIKPKLFGKDKLLHGGKLPHFVTEIQKQSRDEHNCP